MMFKSKFLPKMQKVTGHWSLHPSSQLVVDEALRADTSQSESQSLASAQGHFSKASLEKAAAAKTSPLRGRKLLVRGPNPQQPSSSW